MYSNYTTAIITTIFLGIHIFVQGVAACLMLTKRNVPHDRSWKLITLFFVASVLATGYEIMVPLRKPILDAFEMLQPLYLIPGFLIFFTLFAYLIEMVRPHWLNLKRTTLLMLPWYIVVLTFFVVATISDVRVLYSLTELREYIAEPNVWIRLLMCVLFIPYVFVLFLWKNNWHNRTIPTWITHSILFITLCLTFTYFGSRGLQLFPAYVLHEVLYLVVTFLILYVEFYERLHIPAYRLAEINQTEMAELEDDKYLQIANKLRKVLDESDIWQNPDLSRDDLVRLVATNRTYLAEAMKKMGYANVMDMVHNRRVEYVCEQLRQNPTLNIQDVFYDAGYRSRSTAWRHFIAIVGCTPTEYVEKIAPPQHDKVND